MPLKYHRRDNKRKWNREIQTIPNGKGERGLADHHSPACLLREPKI